MMRSPYQSPKKPPEQRFLRRRPAPEAGKKRRFLLVGVGVVAAYLAYTFVLSDTGLLRIGALRKENQTLRQQKMDLAVRVNDLETRRKRQANDPLLMERVARERFHLVKKDELLYRYNAVGDSAR